MGVYYQPSISGPLAFSPIQCPIALDPPFLLWTMPALFGALACALEI